MRVPEPRPYQWEVINGVHAAWMQNHNNVMAVLPTGGGKTITFGHILANWPYGGTTWAVAHRQELVGQISCSLGMFGIEHNVVAPPSVVKWISTLHVEKFGRPFYNQRAPHYVAGVDTLLRRHGEYEAQMNKANLWVMDECHHVLQANKWGKAVNLFPNARGLGVTATPLRADGKGLGRQWDGVFDHMVVGPDMRELMDLGFLTPYRVYAPEVDFSFDDVGISAVTGDRNRTQLRQSAKRQRAQIVGGIVENYLKYAPGKLGVTFVTDVDTAKDVAAQFNAAGVPAAAVSAKTPDRERQQILARFARRELLQLVNVDLFGEGFDLPAIEVIQMARPTESYALFCQQLGRVLRIMEGKEYAIIIDHVGNVERMAKKWGLPDRPPVWTLEPVKRSKKKSPGTIPMKTCLGCTAQYEAYMLSCPFCAYVNPPAERSTPEHVDGDLVELDPAVLAALQAKTAKVDESPEAVKNRMLFAGAPSIAAASAAKNQRLRQESQRQLRDSIAVWAGWQRHQGRHDQESYRLFYHLFGVDVESAKALGRRDAEALNATIAESFRYAS